ncbi:hypothetical protein L7F22_017265 [Adiantum nelumboides]|nr:hypothetical protein [Adiantum nelumboides]
MWRLCLPLLFKNTGDSFGSNTQRAALTQARRREWRLREITRRESRLFLHIAVVGRCVFIDDEAHVNEDSNNIEKNTEIMETNVDVEDPLDHNEDESDDSDQEQDNGAKKKKHSRHLGKQISLGFMKETSIDLEKWGPLWRQRNVEFERAL